MANKRQIKKIVNSVIIDIVEESFSAQLFNESKSEASNKVIDAAASLQDDLLSRISQAKSKAEFKAIYADFESKTDELYDQVNKL
jgi:NH3-dependent NAD+ synthetase